MISKILLHTLPSGHSLADRPFEEQPHYMMMKRHHIWKVTMWWKVTINFQYKRHDEVSSSDVISSLIMTNHHDNVHSAFLDKLYYCRYICSTHVGVHSWPPTDCLPPLPWTQPSYWLDHTHHAFSFNLRRQQFLKRKSYYSKKISILLVAFRIRRLGDILSQDKMSQNKMYPGTKCPLTAEAIY